MSEWRDPDGLLQRGDLAYLDAFLCGLVPCKVLAIDDDKRIKVRVTAARRGYTRGEVIEGLRPGRSVVARSQVFVRNGFYCIRGETHALADSVIDALDAWERELTDAIARRV